MEPINPPEDIINANNPLATNRSGPQSGASQVASLEPEGVRWRLIEEFDTSLPAIAGLPDDYFANIVNEYTASGGGLQGSIGDAPSLIVGAADICRFAVEWLERKARARGAEQGQAEL